MQKVFLSDNSQVTVIVHPDMVVLIQATKDYVILQGKDNSIK